MNGSFVYEDVDWKEREVLERILKEIPILAEPSLVSPLNEAIDGLSLKSESAPITKRQAYDSLVFKVTTSEEENERNNYYKIIPVKTSLCEGVTIYYLGKLRAPRFRVTEMWPGDSNVVIETKRGRKTFELGFFR